MTEELAQSASATQTTEAPKAEEGDQPSEQQCCDGKRTAQEHREASEDGKCCSD